jgi:hypothetical protein
MRVLKALTAAGLGLGTMMVSGMASATTTTTPKLTLFGDDTGVITWQGPGDYGARVDSPRDANNSRLALHVLQSASTVDPPYYYDYVGALPNSSGLEGKLVGQVKNLSFDFQNGTSGYPVHVGAGAPRYSIEIDDDNDPNTQPVVAFMAAFYCEAQLPEDTTWSRADFTGRTLAGCTIFVGSETFISNGTKSAWRLLAEAHPTWKVEQGYLLFDEEGTAFVDRLAFQNRMYNSGGSVLCSSEAAC